MGCTDRSVLRPLLGGSTRRLSRQSSNSNTNNNNNSDIELKTNGYSRFDDMEGSSKSSGPFGLACRRISLLIWKNLLLRKRHYVVTALEIVLPTFFAILLAFTKAKVPAELQELSNGVPIKNVTIFPEVHEWELVGNLFADIECRNCVVAYAPKTGLTEKVIEKLRGVINGTSQLEWKAFNTELEIDAYGQQLGISNEKNLKAAIIFQNGFNTNEDNLPKGHKFSYKLRFSEYVIPSDLFPSFQIPGPNRQNAILYQRSGFSGLQVLMDKVLIGIFTKAGIPEEKIILQAFPYPPYNSSFDFNVFFNLLMPMLLSLGFVFIVPSIIRGVVGEKETGIRELMKMMGLPTWMHWLGWMMNAMLLLTVSISIVIFLFFYPFNPSNGGVVEHSDISLWWIVLFLYCMAATSMCFFISSFFQRPTLATTLGIVLWLVSYFALTSMVEKKYDHLNLPEKMFVCLVPNVALTLCIKILAGFEGKAVGAHWSNLFEPMNSIDSLTVGHILFMMVLSSIMYISLTIYIENILPSRYGIRKPWYYIFKISTWCNRSSTSNATITTSAGTDRRPSFEADPVGIAPGVELYNLRKTFGRRKVAVDDVTLKIFDGQITALLGHNGAGKTTTMSMITGLFAPTSGTAIVNGHSISTDLEGARQDLGLCPQHNMLFDKLTVSEHLLFFGRLKGLTAAQATADMKVLVKKLQLSEKINKLSMSLSGGQKRKLNLGMALIGGSKVVILDEPTSGMDPEARRAIWDLLLDMRGHRTIILTTHFMEEADVLGDRIAIMSEGKVKCCGSPMFLKRYYGAGYTLSMTMESPSRPDLILLTVQKHIENATFKSQHAPNSSEIAITLPTLVENTTSKFPEMFSDLEQNKKELGIKNIGLSLTTMDEVFVKVGQLDSDNPEDDVLDYDSSGRENSNNSRSRTNDKLTGLRLAKQQFYALIVKRYLYTLRKRRLFFSQLIMPVLLLILTIYLSNQAREPVLEPPPMTMKLSAYTKPLTLYSADDKALGAIYSSLAGPNAEMIKNGTLIDNLVEVGELDLGKYRERYIVASELGNSQVKAMFSTIAYHASPISLNLASNVILQKLTPNQDYSIEVTSQPFISGVHSMLDAVTPDSAVAKLIPILFAVLLPIGLALLAASFIVFPVEEKLCKAKQLQLMTGVNPFIFWGSSLAWDFFVMVILICVMICCFPIFQTYGAFTAYNGAGVLFLILLVYGFAAISFSYLVSMMVSTVAGGFSLVTVLHVFSGMILCIVVFSFETTGFIEQGNSVRAFARIFPTFGVSISTMRFVEIATLNSRCLAIPDSFIDILCNPNSTIDLQYRSCCPNCETDFPSPACFKPQPYILWSEARKSHSDIPVHTEEVETAGIGQELFFMFLVGIFFQMLLILIEYGILKRVLGAIFKTGSSVFVRNNDDEDVTDEINRVQNLVTSGNLFEDAIVVNNLSKSYGSFAAVSNISFGVHHGECFGLLGVNGAGKTTTFRMLTGDEIRSDGGAYTSMCSLESDRKRFLSNIGYCPQFDGIVGVLTGKEMLELFCRLRGVEESKIHEEATKWLSKLGLSSSGHVQCERYSGGMKRRLSAAMALIGDPPVVMLDEPTSGVDPVARRQFWKVIRSVRESGQAVILTSHSMEECEALCSRLGIMVNGQLQCMGGVQHLKNKFAQGFSLVIKLKSLISLESPDVLSLTKEISEKFHPCTLKDQHQNVLNYQVYNTNIPWDVLFRTMENLRQSNEHLIEDYSVNETTLEEVFLSFARKQYPNRDADVPFLKKLVTCQCLS